MKFIVNTSYMGYADKINRKIKDNMAEGLEDVTLDLKRVAQDSAPKKDGILESSASHEINKAFIGMEGKVGFSAFNNRTGFNYAKWTHDNKYDLGAMSKRKSGGSSKYGEGTVPVGKGYLSNSLEMNRSGYNKHLADKYRNAIK